MPCHSNWLFYTYGCILLYKYMLKWNMLVNCFSGLSISVILCIAHCRQHSWDMHIILQNYYHINISAYTYIYIYYPIYMWWTVSAVTASCDTCISPMCFRSLRIWQPLAHAACHSFASPSSIEGWLCNILLYVSIYTLMMIHYIMMQWYT